MASEPPWKVFFESLARLVVHQLAWLLVLSFLGLCQPTALVILQTSLRLLVLQRPKKRRVVFGKAPPPTMGGSEGGVPRGPSRVRRSPDLFQQPEHCHLRRTGGSVWQDGRIEGPNTGVGLVEVQSNVAKKMDRTHLFMRDLLLLSCFRSMSKPKSFRARSAELAYWLSRRWLSSWQLTGGAFKNLGTVLWAKPS